MSGNLAEHVAIFNASPVYSPTVPLPSLWLFLIFNVLTQYVCIMGVYSISALSNSLTLTLVITLRKFISILISTVWFDNDFTMVHWVSVVLVFGGSLLFTFLQSQQQKPSAEEEEEIKDKKRD